MVPSIIDAIENFSNTIISFWMTYSCVLWNLQIMDILRQGVLSFVYRERLSYLWRIKMY